MYRLLLIQRSTKENALFPFKTNVGASIEIIFQKANDQQNIVNSDATQRPIEALKIPLSATIHVFKISSIYAAVQRSETIRQQWHWSAKRISARRPLPYSADHIFSVPYQMFCKRNYYNSTNCELFSTLLPLIEVGTSFAM